MSLRGLAYGCLLKMLRIVHKSMSNDCSMKYMSLIMGSLLLVCIRHFLISLNPVSIHHLML